MYLVQILCRSWNALSVMFFLFAELCKKNLFANFKIRLFIRDFRLKKFF